MAARCSTIRVRLDLVCGAGQNALVLAGLGCAVVPSTSLDKALHLRPGGTFFIGAFTARIGAWGPAAACRVHTCLR